MSEQIKYEAVFGDQSLFDKASSNDVLAIKINDSICFYQDNDQSQQSGLYVASNKLKLAMRRIIKTPVWTREDQEAGRLPGVGCVVAYHKAKWKTETEITSSWRENDELEIMKDLDEGLFSVFNKRTETCSNLVVDCIKPIETPEERAMRVRIEWSRTASKIANETQGGMSAVYDALLSGELKMPEVKK